MRVATGVINHETSTFTPIETTWESYRNERFGYLSGDEVIGKFKDTTTCLGGFIKAAESHGFELVPTIFANAHPSQPTPRRIFDAILDDMLARMQTASPLDGVLLELHGAMIAEGIDDADGYILGAVRDLVGPEVPIVAQLDIHSNMSQQMIREADVLVGRRTYPEIDMVERSLQCAELMVLILEGQVEPTMALCQIPLVWGNNQVTDRSPMKEAIAELRRIEARSDVLCASLATCFPLADIPDMGASTYVVTNNDHQLAQDLANQFGSWVFERRAAWHDSMPSTTAAIEQAESKGLFPVIFADRHDNTGGGAPGDSTGMLRAFIDAKLEDACVLYIVDAESVQHCFGAGIGAHLDLLVGGKSSPLQGEPVLMRAKVLSLSDGQFVYDGPRNAGLTGCMGPSAHVVEGGVHVLLVSEREQPFGPAFSRTMGLEPARMRYLGIKSTVHFRAGFEQLAAAIQVVAEPGVNNPPGGAVAFRRLGRELYPMHT